MTANTQLLKIGMIGLDTSHVSAFAKLLNDEAQDYHVRGGRITTAYPGGSADFEKSISRVEGYTNELRQKYGVAIVDSPQAVAEQCDAILLESVDGRVHLEQFQKIASYGKPVFIDKPFTVSAADALAIIELAEKHETPLMSCSAVRYAEKLTETLAGLAEDEAVFGVDCYGPMAIEPTQPGLFWYGIHTVEMLYRVLGRGCQQVHATTTADHDVIVGKWSDGRIGTIRGNRSGNNLFGVLVHTQKGTHWVDIRSHAKPYYASLLEQVMDFFITRSAPIDIGQTLEIVRFMERANQSREKGVSLTGVSS